MLTPEQLKQINAVTVIGVCDVLREHYGPDMLSWPCYTDTSLYLRQWCTRNESHLYGRPHDCFSTFEAQHEAWDLGLTKVVVEDLS